MNRVKSLLRRAWARVRRIAKTLFTEQQTLEDKVRQQSYIISLICIAFLFHTLLSLEKISTLQDMLWSLLEIDILQTERILEHSDDIRELFDLVLG